MSKKQKRAALIAEAQTIIEAAKGAPSDEQIARLEAIKVEVDELTADIERGEKGDALIAELKGLEVHEGPVLDGAAKTLGEHFVKSIGSEGLARVKTVTGATVAAPAFKAATDTQTIPAAVAPWLTTYDKTVVRAFRRPVVSDLFGSGTLGDGSNAVSYLVEGAVEGSLATVAEAGAKPQFHVADPTTRTDALKKIAGFLKFSDEMLEDAAFLVSEINERGLYLLALAEENQLLNGAGTGSTVEGLLNRAGVQTETATDAGDNADAIFRAMSKVQTATGLSADAIVINPADYQSLRLSRDGNGQYMGGGFFAGQYGNGGIEWQPAIWGLRTVVSAAVPAGTAVVGAFSAAATVYRKGGVRVESTNSHDEDFTSNLVTTRIEERVALAVRYPAAFVEVTLSDVEA